MALKDAISLEGVRKDFGDFTAISNVTFNIADNEFFTLLGPSGCGKTTLLRMIAGFEETSAGKIRLYGDIIENLPPNKRPINTVFQNYALFPHMTVKENIGFSLKMLGWSKSDINNRVSEMVEMVKLEEFTDRKPSQLSGGQQQRVALARAMASKPKLLLLDEPLSALDLKLRKDMRSELKRLQRDTGITFIFVTHDQEEALSMSDRIAVMSSGKVQQIGNPSEIYDTPANRFVADFIGETNMLNATIQKIDGDKIICRLQSGQFLNAKSNSKVNIGQSGAISIRPEKLIIKKQSLKDQYLEGKLGQSTYIGTDTQFEVLLDKELYLTVRMQNSSLTSENYKNGDQVFLSIADNAAWFLVD